MRENTEMKELSMEDLEKIIEHTKRLGYIDDVKIGQRLIIPVGNDADNKPVFYGALDFTGKSNDLTYDKWVEFTKEITGFEPIGRCILRRTSDKNGMYIFGMADASIGACNVITVFNNMWDLILEVFSWGLIDDEETIKMFADIYKSRDIDKAIEACEETFTHSFFTGLVWGTFEYVEGYKPDVRGFAIK